VASEGVEPEAEDGRSPVLLELPDQQQIRGTVLSRRREPSGWWYEVEVQLWTRTQTADGRTMAEPGPVACWAPANACTPIEGQDYSAVLTQRPDVGAPWLVEELPGGQLVVHRGDCAARHDHSVVRPADAAVVRQAASPRGAALSGLPTARAVAPGRALG
jgi:hypothetical protein